MVLPRRYASGAMSLRIQPAIAIIVVLAGAQLAGILGALLAIPTAAAPIPNSSWIDAAR